MSVLLAVLLGWLALQVPVAVLAGRALSRSTPVEALPVGRRVHSVVAADFRALP